MVSRVTWMSSWVSLKASTAWSMFGTQDWKVSSTGPSAAGVPAEQEARARAPTTAPAIAAVARRRRR
jgi:hypothetical protein